MKGHNKKMELLGSAPIPKALLAMGIPTMIGMMISAIYNLVDAYFVGGLGTSQMGAISVTYPLSQVIVGLLVLEELGHALNRGAHIYGEIGGYGSVNNAMHMTGLKPDGEDLSRAIKIAIHIMLWLQQRWL